MKTVWYILLVLAASIVGCKEEVKDVASEDKTSFTFGIIAKSNDNPVFQVARKGAEDAAKELGEKHGFDIAIEWQTPPQEDAQKQATFLAQLAAAGVDGIGISCSDASLVTKAIDDAIDAGIPVMTWDSDAPDSKRFCFHGIDDLECGRSVMRELVAALNGKGVVAVLAGNQTAPNLQRRVQGTREVAN